MKGPVSLRHERTNSVVAIIVGVWATTSDSDAGLFFAINPQTKRPADVGGVVMLAVWRCFKAAHAGKRFRRRNFCHLAALHPHPLADKDNDDDGGGE